jgi:hypothetical protein
MIILKELVMSKSGTMGLFAAAILTAFAGVSAASASGAVSEDIIRDFQYADRNGDNQISLEEYNLLREKMAGLTSSAEEERRAKFPVYINGYERHFPRNRIYYLSSGAVILYDQGPDRFFK